MMKKRVELYMNRKTNMHDVRGMSDESDMDGEDHDWKIHGSEEENIVELAQDFVSMNTKAKTSIKVNEQVYHVPQIPDMGFKDKEAQLMNRLYYHEALSTDLGCTTESFRSLFKKSLISINDFTPLQAMIIVKQAVLFMNHLKKGKDMTSLMKGKIVLLDFKEPSTRTRCSFQAACYRLGANVIVSDNTTSSSELKGESDEDSIRVLCSLGDLIVTRTKDTGVVRHLSNKLSTPLINGGDGHGEHPSQALLDLTTMYVERPELFEGNRFNGHVTICGDIQKGRTCNSLINLIGMFQGRMTLVSSEEIPSLNDFRAKYPRSDIQVKKSLDLECGKSDFWYITRLQRERRDGPIDGYVKVDKDLLYRCKSNNKLRILHPLPRNEEISTEIDDTPHQRYFKQAEIGLYTRMALLYFIVSQRTNYYE